MQQKNIPEDALANHESNNSPAFLQWIDEQKKLLATPTNNSPSFFSTTPQNIADLGMDELFTLGFSSPYNLLIAIEEIYRRYPMLLIGAKDTGRELLLFVQQNWEKTFRESLQKFQDFKPFNKLSPALRNIAFDIRCNLDRKTINESHLYDVLKLTKRLSSVSSHSAVDFSDQQVVFRNALEFGIAPVVKRCLDLNFYIDRLALLTAAAKGHYDVIRHVVNHALKANKETEAKNSLVRNIYDEAAIRAINEGHTAVVSLFLKSSLINPNTWTHHAPISYALCASRFTLVRMLLNDGRFKIDHYVLFELAISSGEPELVYFILNEPRINKKVLAKDRLEFEVFRIIDKGNVKLMQALLSDHYIANLICTKYLINYAVEAKQHEIATLMKEHIRSLGFVHRATPF